MPAPPNRGLVKLRTSSRRVEPVRSSSAAPSEIASTGRYAAPSWSAATPPEAVWMSNTPVVSGPSTSESRRSDRKACSRKEPNPTVIAQRSPSGSPAWRDGKRTVFADPAPPARSAVAMSDWMVTVSADAAIPPTAAGLMRESDGSSGAMRSPPSPVERAEVGGCG
jgi:hypothetical protein